MHDVSILHDIVFSLDAHLSGFLYSGFRTILDVVVVFDDFCAYESFFEVGVNDSGALWCLPSLVVGPCFHLHRSCGDEGFQVEQRVGFLDEAVDTTLFQA